MNDKFYITIASLPHREQLVAEIFYENFQWIEISNETDKPVIQFYSHPKQEYWEFPLDEALEVLERAKRKFLELDEPKKSH